MSISWLIERFNDFSDLEAIVYNNQSFTYRHILEYYHKWTQIVAADNVKFGEVVAVEGDYSPEMCAVILALIENKNIVVPLSSATSGQKEEFLKIAEADRLYILGDDGHQSSQFSSSKENELIRKLNTMDEPGLILFTSGSTGKAKGVIHNFTKLLEKYKINRDPLRTLTFLLLDHIGGINTLFHTLSNGGTVITSGSRKPEDICEVIEKHKVELLPASPTFLNLLLLSEQYKNYDLTSLKIISYGTEVMPESVLKKLNEVFPNVHLRQTYGLSELGIMRAKSKSSDSLWVKIGGEGFETKIVDDILYIKADSAMLGYLNAPSPFDEEGWFNTQDQVVVDGDYVKILGRKSEIINVGGQKVYPAEVEEILLQMPGIKDVAVKGEPNIILGNIVTAKVNLIEKEDLSSLRDRIQEFCKDKLEPHKIPIKVQIVDDELFNARFKRVRI
ncbi:MAG: long-chain fatty acid--CoA ligase [Clostridia bacterium]|nr:long-chain fatty acid--CoA ligase [Clostridia bacterium]